MAKKTKHNNHVFGRRRPSDGGRFPIHLKPKRDTHFRDLPPPTGTYPYQLDLKSIISVKDYQDIVKKKKLTFHLNGDMGGIKTNDSQMLVARGMEADLKPDTNASASPAFLYIAGDCVYYNGEEKEYSSQFYQPYEFYDRPIFAVPGNHDGENLPTDTSLDGFIRNFCAPTPNQIPGTLRTAMTQPNPYWTLLTPMANIVGLYSNVPEGGEIRSPQTEWLVDQLRTLPHDKPLIIALHHPIYSADNFHSGSTYMKDVLEQAAVDANRQPEMIIAGHVHNYQRITKPLNNGEQILYLVTGAGGYYNLHSMIKVNGQTLSTPVTFNQDQGDPVTLETYSADRHGFMRLEITDQLITGRYYTVPRPQEPFSKGNQLFDYFEFDWRNRKIIPNHL